MRDIQKWSPVLATHLNTPAQSRLETKQIKQGAKLARWRVLKKNVFEVARVVRLSFDDRLSFERTKKHCRKVFQGAFRAHIILPHLEVESGTNIESLWLS